MEVGKALWLSGNCKTTAYMVCNAHIGCGRHLKVHKVDDIYYVSFKGDHTQDPTLGKRKNSTLTWDQEAALMSGVDQGGRPSAVRVST